VGKVRFSFFSNHFIKGISSNIRPPTSMAESAATLGNFKGVMLCNRPQQIPGSLQAMATAIHSATGSISVSRPAFVSSVVAESAVGLAPSKSSALYTANLSSRAGTARHSVPLNQANQQHKLWLKEFQAQRALLEKNLTEKAEKIQQRQRDFQENCQATRDTIRAIKHDENAPESDKAEAIAALLGTKNLPSSYKVPTEYTDTSEQFPVGYAAQTLNKTNNLPSKIDENSAMAFKIPAFPIPHAQSQLRQPQELPIAVDSAAAAPSFTVSAAVVPLSDSELAKTQLARPSLPTSILAAPKEKKGAKSAKPGWARTEVEEALNLDAEAEDLLNFAQDLNYEDYIEDIEVREAVKFVQDRVNSIEEEKKKAAEQAEKLEKLAQLQLEHEKLAENPENQLNSARSNLSAISTAANLAATQRKLAEKQRNHGWNDTLQAQGGPNFAQAVGNSENSSELARGLLDSNRNLRAVHSTASVKAILEKERENSSGSKAGNGQNHSNSHVLTLQGAPASGSLAVSGPLIAVIHEKVALPSHQASYEGRASKQPDPNNLPYLYRHPAI
jgi:predicted  nucleic acid-binding Zn-ribbon protein